MLNAIKNKDKDKKKQKTKQGRIHTISSNNINTLDTNHNNNSTKSTSSSSFNRQNTIKIKNKKKHFNQFNFNSLNDNLLEKIINQHDSNRRCCDCNSINDVDWISTNLLCILCINCSGIHRSMGSHISKIKSIKYDNFDNNLELIYLLENFISNKVINSIYESKLKLLEKITPNVNDSVRLKFINDKYFLKKFVSHKSNDINKLLENLVTAMEAKDVFKLIKLIAQSEISLKKLSIKFNSNLLVNNSATENYDQINTVNKFNLDDPTILREINLSSDIIDETPVTKSSYYQYPETIFQKSLKHNILINNKHIFFITEFLLNNDMVIDNDNDNFKLLHNLIEDNRYRDNSSPNLFSDTKTYWQLKFDTLGTYKKNSKSDPSLNNIKLSSPNSRDCSIKNTPVEAKLLNNSVQKVSIPSYGNLKDASFSSTTVTSSSTNNNSFSNNESITRKQKKSSNKNRWSLSYIQKTSQNIITMHKSLKRQDK